MFFMNKQAGSSLAMLMSVAKSSGRKGQRLLRVSGAAKAHLFASRWKAQKSRNTFDQTQPDIGHEVFTIPQPHLRSFTWYRKCFAKEWFLKQTFADPTAESACNRTRISPLPSLYLHLHALVTQSQPPNFFDVKIHGVSCHTAFF